MKVERWRTWSQIAENEATPLLRENRTAGYSSWFALIMGKSIWWIYSDSSDGGVWSNEGIAITGFRIEYDESIA